MRYGMIGLLFALNLLTTAAPVRAADIGREMEKEYGIVTTATDEGAQLLPRFEEVVRRITDGVGLKVKSATLLGGKNDKRDKVLNAFALPDGRIYVTLGLMREIRKSKHPDDALAFVVGHEVTHVKEQHAKRQQKKTITAMIIGAAAAAAFGAKGGAIGDWGSLAGNLYGSHYSRIDEYRADKGGLIGMHNARFDKEGAVELLQILEKEGGNENKTLNGWMGSHPITRNRISRVRELMREIDTGTLHKNPTEKDLEKDDKRTRGG